jgi:hypothetical protein
VACVGVGGNGQLGNGIASPDPVSDWYFVAGINDALDVECGELATCVLRQGGKVSCWGFSLSVGNNNAGNALTPYETLPSGAVALACGDQHTCAIMDDASVKCWCAAERGFCLIAAVFEDGGGRAWMCQLYWVGSLGGRSEKSKTPGALLL